MRRRSVTNTKYVKNNSETFQKCPEIFRDIPESVHRFSNIFRDFSDVSGTFSEFVSVFFNYVSEMFQRHSFLLKVSGMVTIMLGVFSMIFEHFPYIARECSEIVHRGCFNNFLENYKDCSNIFLRFFRNDSEKFT